MGWKGKGKGKAWDPRCVICRSPDHWKAECPLWEVVCEKCGGNHIPEICRWYEQGEKAEGKAKAKGGGKALMGKGPQREEDKITKIPKPVCCKKCNAMQPSPDQYWCIKPGCGGICMKAKTPGGGGTSGKD